MSKYSVEQRIFVLKEYLKTEYSYTRMRRDFQTKFNVKEGPSRHMVTNLIEKFERTGSVADDLVGNVGRPSTARTEENIASVKAAIDQSPRKSIRKIAAKTGIKPTNVHRILRKDLELFPYKIQTVTPLTPDDKTKRENFANDMLFRKENSEISFDKIFFTDEANFHTNGYVNKQNWRFWGTARPEIAVHRTAHPQRTTVWAAISGGRLFGPYFIHSNVNSVVYVETLKQYWQDAVQTLPTPEEIWFMQDGARPHRTRAVFDYLEETFDDRVIALDYPEAKGKGIEWPPYSPDLNPCDFFLWGFIKDIVYRKSFTDVNVLEQAIIDAFAQVEPEMLAKVAQNFEKRMGHIVVAGGATFENVIS